MYKLFSFRRKPLFVSIPSRGKAFPDWVLKYFSISTHLSFHPLSGKIVSRLAGCWFDFRLHKVSIPSWGKAFPDKPDLANRYNRINVSIPSRGKAFPDSSSEEPYPARVPEAKSTHLFSLKKIYSDSANFRG
jgi:hypothetical protein